LLIGVGLKKMLEFLLPFRTYSQLY